MTRQANNCDQLCQRRDRCAQLTAAGSLRKSLQDLLRLFYYLIMTIIKFRKLADKIRNEQWSNQRIKALESIFIYRRSDIKNLLKEIKAYRNSMVARNYPSQELSDIITKWEIKLSKQSQDELEPINSSMSDE